MKLTSDCCAMRTRECDKGLFLVLRSICVQLQIASLLTVIEMPYCMAPGCTNHSKKTTGVSYHRLPQDKRRKAVWLARIRRANPCLSKYSFVCSAHFSPESFVTDLVEQLCGHNNRRRRRANHIPPVTVICSAQETSNHKREAKSEASRAAGQLLYPHQLSPSSSNSAEMLLRIPRSQALHYLTSQRTISCHINMADFTNCYQI